MKVIVKRLLKLRNFIQCWDSQTSDHRYITLPLGAVLCHYSNNMPNSDEFCENCNVSVTIVSGRLKRQLFGKIINRRDFTADEALLEVFGKKFTPR